MWKTAGPFFFMALRSNGCPRFKGTGAPYSSRGRFGSHFWLIWKNILYVLCSNFATPWPISKFWGVLRCWDPYLSNALFRDTIQSWELFKQGVFCTKKENSYRIQVTVSFKGISSTFYFKAERYAKVTFLILPMRGQNCSAKVSGSFGDTVRSLLIVLEVCVPRPVKANFWKPEMDFGYRLFWEFL